MYLPLRNILLLVKPYLLEVNHTPSFTADTPLDRLIKCQLIRDTLKILNLNMKS